MKINCDLLSKIKNTHGLTFTGITASSSKCIPGFLFVATAGALKTSKDGHDFIDEAINNGATAVVFDNEKYAQETRVPMIKVPDSKVALSYLCEEFYGWPSKRLKIIGITGTNGKTSTSFMLHSILKEAGFKPKIMGTLGMGDPGNLLPLSHTTMDAEFVSHALNDLRQNGATHVIMEISSHALSLKRVEAINFSAVALTNITQDHLDFHGSLKDYQDAKARLFFELAKKDTKIILPASHPFEKIPGAVLVEDHQGEENHFTWRKDGSPLLISLPFSGGFHVKNARLSATIAQSLGVCDEHIVSGLLKTKTIPGRLQWIESVQDFKVVVDFAHTPDALSNLLSFVKNLGSIILVFGCGGDRDQKKRAIMGKVAEEFASHIIVTDDNPRTEDPKKIRQDIMRGIGKKNLVEEIADRRLAIQTAIKRAKKNDIVVIAGKGHENYQIYQTIKTDFSDQHEAKKALDEL